MEPPFEALGDNILMREMERKDKSEGVLIVPDIDGQMMEMTMEHFFIGKIVALGPGKFRDDGTFKPMEVNEGEIVLVLRMLLEGKDGQGRTVWSKKIREGRIWWWQCSASELCFRVPAKNHGMYKLKELDPEERDRGGNGSSAG